MSVSPGRTKRILLLCGSLVLLLSCLLLAQPALGATTYRTIPPNAPRLMWQNGNGYCGESSLQVVGIQMGFWVGQNQARNLAGGEALLAVNYDTLLDQLHLDYTSWSGGYTLTDRKNFTSWIRDGAIQGYPVIFAVKTHDTWGLDRDYDHIMVADAVTTSQGVGGPYNAADVMYYCDTADGTENSHTFDEWVNGYTNVNLYYYLPPCARVTLVNGKKVNCRGYQYGVKIAGQDGSSECRPVSLNPVAPSHEANVTQGGTSSPMSATATMKGLTVGQSYALLRWDVNYTNIATVPWSNILASAGPSNYVTTFTAGATTATCPVTFMSDGITFFRCVATD